jgi:hypothetical protein
MVIGASLPDAITTTEQAGAAQRCPRAGDDLARHHLPDLAWSTVRRCSRLHQRADECRSPRRRDSWRSPWRMEYDNTVSVIPRSVSPEFAIRIE